MFCFCNQPGPMEKRALAIFEKRMEKRGLRADPAYVIRAELSARCAPEEFRLSGGIEAKELKLEYGSPVAFLYAAGKILRTGEYCCGVFRPGKWRGVLRPEKTYRCVYLASHFFNFYQVAPQQDVEEYIEDLALLGYNMLALTCGTHVMEEGSPEYFDMLGRIKKLFLFANQLGMKARIGCSNGGFMDSPQELRAKPTGRSWFGTEICPSDPRGLDYIEKIMTERCEFLRDVDFGAICMWPYDQGGCGCEKCAPYGANGMFLWADRLAPVIKRIWPGCKIEWSTWLYDRAGYPLGEWQGLYDRINSGKADYIDYIMADSHQSFPLYPLTHPLPGHVELVTFPEISMYGRSPWGGFGATPLPRRFSALWGEVAHLASGGVLYSEGIFEDFNKALYAEFFRSGNNETHTAVQEYFHYECGLPDSAERGIARFLELLELNHPGVVWQDAQPTHSEAKPLFEPMKTKPVWRRKGKTWSHTEEMLALAENLQSRMPEWGRNCWRWRLFYLRSVIDRHLDLCGNETDEVTENAIEELCRIYKLDVPRATRRIVPYTDFWLKSRGMEPRSRSTKDIGLD